MIKSVHLENFRVLSGVHDYEFPEGIIGIVGPNGQGKSTLINSISWALYGTEALPLRARDPITWGQKECLVRVHLVLNDGQEWIVERGQKSSSSTGKAKLYQPDKEPKASGSAPVTAAVAELLGVDREGFLISVFARQNELDRLRSMDAAPRMQTVLRLLGINQISKAITIVREQTKEHRQALEALRGHQIDAEEVEHQLASYQSELSSLTAEAVSEAQKLDEAKASLAKLQADRDSLEPQRKAYYSYLNDLQAKKTTLMLAERSHDSAHKDVNQPEPEKPVEPEYKTFTVISDESITEKKNLYLKYRDDYTELKARHDTLVSQVNDLKDVCPMCGRPFDDADHIDRERKVMLNNIADYASSMQKIARLGENAKNDWENAGREKRESDLINQNNARLEADFVSKLRNYETVMAHRQEARERYARAQTDLALAQQALESLKPVEDVTTQEREYERQIDSVNLVIRMLTEEYSQDQARISGMKAEIARLNAALAEAQEAQKKAKSAEKAVVAHETTAEELQHLKESMIGGIIPSLNAKSSVLVEMMSEGKYTDLSLTPDYEIEYRNSLGDYKNFLNLSGGEQTVFALALRLAISDARAGNLGVLFLDEAISNLSSEDGRQESVWSAIESLTSRFKQVFVITHVEAYKDRAPFTVRL
jgi:exonuclease SbcC